MPASSKMQRGGQWHAISIRLILQLFFIFPCLALSQSRVVRSLPGFHGPLPFHLETGYIGVGDRNEHQLFYYFVESEGNPKEDPLVLWLTGGPGCSAWSGLVYEIGPLYFEYALYNGTLPSLKLREYPWTKISSVIFVDSPVGTGFSFSSGSKDYVLDDIKTAKEVYQFLIKWLIAHQEFLSNPLYIAGDSYCGLILPVVVNEIANGIEAGKEPIVNLKGYSLGNPLTDILIDKSSFVPYAHGMGLIPDELYQSAKKSCGEVYARPRNVECSKDIEAVNANIAGLEEGQILEPKCAHASPKPFTVGPGRLLDENSRALRLPDILPGLGCRSYWYLLSHYWANDGSVRKAIGIPKGKIREWERCVKDLPYEASLMSSVNYHIKLTSRGYRALIYSGDHDLKVSFVGTLQWIKSLNFSIVSEWRPWMVDGQIAGYTTAFSNNFTFATVKGAGHTAPEYKPKECFAMLQRWISHNPL